MDELVEILIDAICVNPYQPRCEFDEHELWELAYSIKEVGLIQPPVVRPMADGKYQLVSGERRMRAAKLAGMESIPAIVRSMDDELSAKAALIENVQRSDLNAIEVAKALHRLMEEFRLTQKQLEEKVGKKRSTIANYLRLLNLTSDEQQSVAGGQITMGHAKALLAIDDPELRDRLHKKLVRTQLSVREAEKLAKGKGDLHLEDLVRRLESHLGMRVKATNNKITIEYADYDELDILLGHLGVQL